MLFCNVWLGHQLFEDVLDILDIDKHVDFQHDSKLVLGYEIPAYNCDIHIAGQKWADFGAWYDKHACAPSNGAGNKPLVGNPYIQRFSNYDELFSSVLSWPPHQEVWYGRPDIQSVDVY